jgi:hypothetical protein
VTPNASPQNLALILGLSFFFGLAYEDFYAQRALYRPGGVRTFPLLALLGAGLYLVEPAHALAFSAGLLVLGAWLHAWYRSHVMLPALHPVLLCLSRGRQSQAALRV